MDEDITIHFSKKSAGIERKHYTPDKWRKIYLYKNNVRKEVGGKILTDYWVRDVKEIRDDQLYKDASASRSDPYWDWYKILKDGVLGQPFMLNTTFRNKKQNEHIEYAEMLKQDYKINNGKIVIEWD